MTRHFWVLVHRYAGLHMALFLIVAGLTGSILAFRPELDAWLIPTPQIIPQAGPKLDEFSLRERAAALIPQALPNMLAFEHKPNEAYRFQLTPRLNPETNTDYELPANNLFLNPYTGEEVARESQTDGLWPITRKNLMTLIVTLHYSLALPEMLGVWLFGVAALIWTVDCFVSAYLTFPVSVRRHTAETPVNVARKSWGGA